MVGATFASGATQLYINGAADGTETTTHQAVCSDEWVIDMGCARDDAGNPASWSWLDGEVGEVLIFNSVLSPSDVLEYFNATKARYGIA